MDTSFNKPTLHHFKQKTNVTCGAAAYRIALSDIELISEKQAVDEVKTTKSGTSILDIRAALTSRNYRTYLISLNTDWLDYEKWLIYNSKNRKLFLTCEFRDVPYGGGRGRPRLRRHCVLAYNGFIYDPSENEPVPIEAYSHVFSKSLTIKEMLLWQQ